MNIEILCVGKLKEKYLTQGMREYLKRLQAYAKVKIIEVKDEPTDKANSPAEIEQVLAIEAERLLPHLTSDRHIITLDIEGRLMTSEGIAKELDQLATYGRSKVTFVIGGSLGLHSSIDQKADLAMSFGRITLPHQLMRLVLVEQIYRAFRINHNHAYHK